jgi:cell division transport system permease protein
VPGVESVHYGQDVVDELFKITQIIRIGGIVLIAFLAAATLFIISNTIRLTVFARRKEIAIMKYVGATNGFIRWPFVIGGLIAVACTGEFYYFITSEIEQSLAFFPLVPMFPIFYQLAVALLIIGIFVGAIGSAISLRQYMRV